MTFHRRRFITGLCAGVFAPRIALAQTASIPKVGVFQTGNPAFDQAFVEGMAEQGLVDGRNVQFIHMRGSVEQLPALAEELVRANVNVIFAPTPPMVQAVRKATVTIPTVVAVVGDPVATGLAASLAHPGGHVTGLTALGSSLGAKRLEILKEITPHMRRVAIIINPDLPDKAVEWKNMAEPAQKLKVSLLPVEARTAGDLDGAFASVQRQRADAFIGLPEPMLFANRGRVIEFAARARLATIFAWTEAVDDGGLIAYGANIAYLYRRAATHVAKILRGAKPADLPIEQPLRFDFAVNLKTARALGIKMPQSILVRATKVIE